MLRQLTLTTRKARMVQVAVCAAATGQAASRQQARLVRWNYFFFRDRSTGSYKMNLQTTGSTIGSLMLPGTGLAMPVVTPFIQDRRLGTFGFGKWKDRQLAERRLESVSHLPCDSGFD
jgi:hypothetical protein